MAAIPDFYPLKHVLFQTTPFRRSHHAINFTCSPNFSFSKPEFQFHSTNYLSARELRVFHKNRPRRLEVCCRATGAGLQPKPTAPSAAEIEFAARVGKDRLLKVQNRLLHGVINVVHWVCVI